MTRSRFFSRNWSLVAVPALLVACSSSSSTKETGGDSGSPGDSATPLGPGSAFKCKSTGKDAWDTYGQSAFVAVNESIFSIVGTQLASDAGATGLGGSFSMIGKNGYDDAATFQGKLAAFLVYAYGGPTSITYTDGKTYDGVQNIVGAHTGLGITTDEYNYFVTNVVVAALSANKVPMDDITSCFAPVITNPAFMAEVVGH